MSLQLYIASGHALLDSVDEFAQRLFFEVLVVSLTLVTVVCEVYADYFGNRDSTLSLHFYESWSGWAVMTLNTLLFVQTCRAMHGAHVLEEKSRAVRRFYFFTFVSASLYFLSTPAMCVLTKLLEPWHRRKVINASELCVRFVATVVLLCYLRPSKFDAVIAARLERPGTREVAMEMSEAIAAGPFACVDRVD